MRMAERSGSTDYIALMNAHVFESDLVQIHIGYGFSADEKSLARMMEIAADANATGLASEECIGIRAENFSSVRKP